MNLIVTCARHFEDDASEEISEILEELGDDNPHVTISDMSGILYIKTNVDPVSVTRTIKEKISDEPWSIRYCLRIIPIQETVSTELEKIVECVQKYQNIIKSDETYRITIEKRNSSISSMDIISKIAENIPSKVSLENPNWVILIEILAENTGISIVKESDIVSLEREKRALSE